MTDTLDPNDVRKPRFVIMDNTPISLLAIVEGLDWLFKPGCEVVITDMVIAEATREPGEGRDQRRNSRNYVAEWLESNRHRITVLRTSEGENYEREMALWERAGKPEDLRPNWNDRGERSLLAAVQNLKQALAQYEEFIVIMDDRNGRDAVKAVRTDIRLMGTRTFIRWMDEDFGVAGAAHAWQTIRMATSNTADEGIDDDPVYIRGI